MGFGEEVRGPRACGLPRRGAVSTPEGAGPARWPGSDQPRPLHPSPGVEASSRVSANVWRAQNGHLARVHPALWPPRLLRGGRRVAVPGCPPRLGVRGLAPGPRRGAALPRARALLLLLRLAPPRGSVTPPSGEAPGCRPRSGDAVSAGTARGLPWASARAGLNPSCAAWLWGASPSFPEPRWLSSGGWCEEPRAVRSL